jgi:hypothetical protein
MVSFADRGSGAESYPSRSLSVRRNHATRCIAGQGDADTDTDLTTLSRHSESVWCRRFEAAVRDPRKLSCR